LARFFIAEEDLHALLFVDEESFLVMQADECEAAFFGYMIQHRNFVVLLDLLI
jgi:hypothetical protein